MRGVNAVMIQITSMIKIEAGILPPESKRVLHGQVGSVPRFIKGFSEERAYLPA